MRHLPLLATLLSLAICATAPAQPIALRPVVTGLDSPLAVTHAGDGRVFITSQKGFVYIFDGTQLLATPFLDIHTLVACCGERGLLGVAFHPNFSSNGFFYVDYTDPTGDINIARYSVSADPNRADGNSGVILLTIPHRDFANHNGGQLAFGPDGFLYAGIGDGGSAGDPNGNGQNLEVLLGKILRIDIDNGTPYGIPPLNPFAGRTDARHEIWAYGLRNPWRFSFDRETGELLIGDVGQGAWEEVDYQLAASPGGENYGWRIMEGTHCYNATTCNQSGLVLPILEYGHTAGNCSITGGYRYRGARSARLRGTYIYGDYCTGVIWGATQAADGSWSSTQLLDAPFQISAFGEGFDKELYVVDYSGRVLIIEDPLAPAITSITPAFGRSTGGDSVTIAGTNLTNPSSVTFGGSAATITASSATSITVTTPPATALGTVDVIVTNSAGMAKTNFRYDLGFPTTVTATATSSTAVNITWSAVPGATSYEVVRSANGTTFSTVNTTSMTSLTDNGATANTAYLYKVRAAHNGVFAAYSARDLATTVIFADDPLTAGMIVKSVHVTQLRTAVNAVRTLAGIGTVTFTDPIAAGATVIKAVHLTELRSRLDEARSSLSLPALAYADTVIAMSTPVRAAHFTEVRNGVK